MKGKVSISVFLVVFLVFGFGWAKEFHVNIAGEAPLVKLWEESYSPSDFNFLMDIAIDGYDNIIVTGITGLFDGIATIKYDSDGQVIWTNSDSSVDVAYAIAVDSLNNIIVGAGHPLAGYNIIKYAPNGTTDWTSTYNEGGAKIVWSVACDGDDNIIVLGDTQPDQGWMTLKYDKQGVLLWNKPFGCPDGRAGYPQSVAVDSYNNIILAGYGYYNSSSNTDIVIIKYDPAGNMLWSEPVVYDSGNYDYAKAVCVDKEDNIIVVGFKGIPAHDFRLYVRKYDPDGNFIWETGENSLISMGYAVTIDKNDRILVGGTKDNGDKNNYIVCYDTSGKKRWDFSHNPTHWNDEIYGLAVDSNNNIAVGSTAGASYLTEKYGYVECEGDFDKDGDVDGSDLAVFAAGGASITLEKFAINFGRTNCP